MEASSHCLETQEKEKLLEETQNASDELSQPETRKQYGVLLIIIFLQFFSRITDTILYPFFPEAATIKGLSMTEVGITMAAFDISRFVFSPILGSLLLKWPPKSMAAVGTVINCLGCAGLGTTGLVNSRGWYFGLCVVIRVIAGIGSTMVTIGSTSLLLNASGFSSTTIIGAAETVSGCAFSLGPAFGGVLYELVGYDTVFWIFAGLLLSALPAFLFIVPSVVEETIEVQKNFFDLLSIPGCLLMFIACMFLRINGCSLFIGISEFFIAQFHSTVSLVGVLLGIGAFFFAIGCAIAARMADKFPRSNFPVLILGYLFSAIFWFLVGPSPLFDFIFGGHKYIWLTVMMVLGANVAASAITVAPMPAALDLAAVNGHPRESLHTYGMVTGLINCGWSLGATTGPIIAGAIIDALNFEWTMTCVAFADIAMALLIVTYLLYMRLTNQPIAPPADPLNQYITI